MPEQNPSPESGKASFETENYQDYAGALQTIASARGLFLLLLVLTLLTHAGAYSLARWAPATLGLSSAPDEAGTAEQAEEPGSAEAEGDAGTGGTLLRTEQVRRAVEAVLPIAAFVGLVCCLLLLLCYLLAVNVALSGGLGGVRGSLAAFFWLLVVLVLLLPWARCLGGAGVYLPGVYSTADEVLNLPAQFAGLVDEVVHYVRFLGYPGLVLLIVLVGDRRFARAYRLAHRQIEARLAVRRI